MKFQFPNQQKGVFTQINRGNMLGAFWSTMAIDLQSNLGIIRTAQRLRISTDTTDDSDVGNPVAFMVWDLAIFAVCGAKIFRNTTSPNTTFTEDASSGTPTDFSSVSDLGIFDGRLWATTANALYSKAGNGSGTGAWTSRDTISAAAGAPIVSFVKFPRIYYASLGLGVSSIDASNVVSAPGADYALTILGGGNISAMEANSSFIWIAVNANSSAGGLFGRIVQWDGISQQITNEFPVKSARLILGMVILNDIPYCMDNNGILSKYTGYSFEEVGRLPFGPLLTSSGAPICKNGMVVTKNNTILVNVNNKNAGNTANYNENNYSGGWEWSEEFGFVQKFVYTYNKNGSSTITDYGQNQISVVGAVFDVSNFSINTSGTNGQYLFGCTYLIDASGTRSGIFFDDTNNTIQKKGYFVTTWIFSEEIQDKFTHLYAIFRRLLSASDSIVFKYRLTEEDPTYADITWVDTTHFTTTTDVTGYWTAGPSGTTSLGGEVEILQGTGGGTCAHITSVVNNAGTYTVTLDAVVTGVTTGTAKARFQHWVKINEPITTQTSSYQQMAIAGDLGLPNTFDTRVQFKCCMTFTGNDELHKFYLASKEDITINL